MGWPCHYMDTGFNMSRNSGEIKNKVVAFLTEWYVVVAFIVLELFRHTISMETINKNLANTKSTQAKTFSWRSLGPLVLSTTTKTKASYSELCIIFATIGEEERRSNILHKLDVFFIESSSPTSPPSSCFVVVCSDCGDCNWRIPHSLSCLWEIYNWSTDSWTYNADFLAAIASQALWGKWL